MAHFVYILRSLKDHRLYVGETRDVQKRLDRHNSGLTRSTRHRGPFELVAAKRLPDRSAALRLEKLLKTLAGSEEKNRLVAEGRIEL